MKKSLLLIILLSCFTTTPSYALNKNSYEIVNLCIEKNKEKKCIETPESIVYKVIYDQKFENYYYDLIENLEYMGFDASYFIDDIKKYMNCYADIFATKLTINDVNTIYNYNLNKKIKDAIINNISNKYQYSCQYTYMPYINNLKSLLVIYKERVCKEIFQNKGIEISCQTIYNNKEDIKKCTKIKQNQEYIKCADKAFEKLETTFIKNHPQNK